MLAGTAPAYAQAQPDAGVQSGGPAAPPSRDAAKDRMQQRCEANPPACEEMKAKMRERREQCKADPAKCRAEMKARRDERCKANPQRCEEEKARRERCKADPQKCRAEMRSRFEQRFKQADADGSGGLSRAEAKRLPTIAKHFDEIDANKDGQVTLEEIDAAHKAHAAQRKSAPANKPAPAK
jgi:hypothetical protein